MKKVKVIGILMMFVIGIMLVGGNVLAQSQKNSSDEKIKLFIQILNNENEYPRARYEAALNLAEIKDKRTVKFLIKTLDDKDRWIRGITAYALGNIGDKRAVRPLIKALDDENYWVRLGAAHALGLIKDRRAVEPLIKTLDDESCWTKCRAAYALGEIEDKRAIEPIIKLLIKISNNKKPISSELWRETIKPLPIFALKKLTNQNLGNDYDVWINWWKENKDEWIEKYH